MNDGFLNIINEIGLLKKYMLLVGSMEGVTFVIDANLTHFTQSEIDHLCKINKELEAEGEWY